VSARESKTVVAVLSGGGLGWATPSHNWSKGYTTILLLKKLGGELMRGEIGSGGDKKTYEPVDFLKIFKS